MPRGQTSAYQLTQHLLLPSKGPPRPNIGADLDVSQAVVLACGKA